MIDLVINGAKHSVDADPETPLLWVLREQLKLTGTKFGCGQGLCGSCTVHIDGKMERSCQVSVKSAQGKTVTTIEGISEEHPVKRAWQTDEVVQCGWCQPGQILAAAALLKEKPQPTDEDIDKAMEGNLCRCGTYQRIRRAIHTAAKTAGEGAGK